jgi:hypothetical protein
VTLGLIFTASVFFLSDVLNMFLSQDLWKRFLLTWMLIAPAGIFMGMLFPLGIKLVDEHAPNLIPWVWGINAYATVIGSIISVMIAINLGFTAVFVIAAGTYIFGALCLTFGLATRKNDLA